LIERISSFTAKHKTILLCDDIAAIIFLENYQFILSGTWQAFVVAT